MYAVRWCPEGVYRGDGIKDGQRMFVAWQVNARAAGLGTWVIARQVNGRAARLETSDLTRPRRTKVTRVKSRALMKF